MSVIRSEHTDLTVKKITLEPGEGPEKRAAAREYLHDALDLALSRIRFNDAEGDVHLNVSLSRRSDDAV